MDKNLEGYLQKKHPSQFVDLYGDKKDTCLAFGLACSEGWFPIIEQACARIQEILDKNPVEFKWLQIKEKWGQLTLNGAFTNEEEAIPAVYDIIKEAQTDSLKVCEICGIRGKVTTKGIWVRTLCNKCRFG